MRTIIVSGCDAGFFHMTKGLILSLKDCPESAGVDLGLLDVGLEDEQRAWFADNGVAVVAPDWDLRHPYTDQLPSNRKAFFSRPFLPKHFPGYDMYVWMDADTWAQDWQAVAMHIEAAKDGALAIVPELDRAYERNPAGVKIRTILGRPYRISSVFYKRFRRAWGRRAANKYALQPILNNGLFALRADAVHWQPWREIYQRGLDKYPRGGRRSLCQVSLNYAVYDLELPYVPLPARFNWLTYLALPKLDTKTGRYVEPLPPYDPISVIHNVHSVKDRPQTLTTTDGKTVEQTILYRHGDY